MSRFRAFLKRTMGRHLRITMVDGLLLLFPVAITYLLLNWLFSFANGVLQEAVAPVVDSLFGWSFNGLGLIALLVLVYLMGLLWATAIGKRLVRMVQRYLLNLPIVGAVYSPARQLIESFTGSGTSGFKRVVLIEYPRTGAWMLGFLTGTTTVSHEQSMGIVYLPTAPTPNSGWVALVPIEDIFDTDLSVKAAMSMILSGGIASPALLDKRVMEDISAETMNAAPPARSVDGDSA